MSTQQETMKGKVAIVTGGGSGIGLATALLFSERGAHVVVADYNQEAGIQAVNKIQQAGGKAMFVKTDVTQSKQVMNMVNKTMETYGKLDYAFNNAGIDDGFVQLQEYTEDLWDRVISINLKGIWLCMKYEIPKMIEGGGGAIVNISSTAGVVAYNYHYAYVASKHGVIGVTKTAALDFAAAGIRVNAVCPSAIDTGMPNRFIGNDPKLMQLIIDGHAIKRLGKPKEVAETVVWLCSDAASFITGAAVMVDGGATAM